MKIITQFSDLGLAFFVRSWTILVLFTILSVQCTSSKQHSTTAFREPIVLHDMVLLNLQKSEIYLTGPDLRLFAIDINSGKINWKTSISARPLHVDQGMLLVQLEEEGAYQSILLGELDLEGKGKLVRKNKLALPKGIQARLKNNQNDQFFLRSFPVEKSLLLEWNYFPPFRRDFGSGTGNPQMIRGAFVGEGLDFKSTQNPLLEKQKPDRSIIPAPQQRIPGKENAHQFISGDRKHLLVSWKRTGTTDLRWYRWELYEAQTKKLIGSLNATKSFAPFVVVGNSLLSIEGPYVEFDSKSETLTPLRLVMYDLAGGELIWDQEILDNIPRGAFAPQVVKQID